MLMAHPSPPPTPLGDGSGDCGGGCGGGGGGGGGDGDVGGGSGGEANAAFVDSSSVAALMLGGPADGVDCSWGSNVLVPPPTPGLTPDGGGRPGRRPRADMRGGVGSGDAHWRHALPSLGLDGRGNTPAKVADAGFSGWADTVAPVTAATPVVAAGKQHLAGGGSSQSSCLDTTSTESSTSPTTITPTPQDTPEAPLPAKGHEDAEPRRSTHARQLTLPTAVLPDAAAVRKSIAYWLTVEGYAVSGESPKATAARLSDAAAMARAAPPSTGDGNASGGSIGGGGGSGGAGTGPRGAARLYEAAAKAWAVATGRGSAEHLQSLVMAGELYLSLRRLTDAGDRARAAIAAYADWDGTGGHGKDDGGADNDAADPAAAAVAAAAEYSAAHYLLGRVYVARGRAAAAAERHATAEQAYREALEAYRVAYMVMRGVAAAAAAGGSKGESTAAGRAVGNPPPSGQAPTQAPVGRPLKVVRVAKAIHAVLHHLNAAVAAQGRRLDITEATSAFEWPPPPLRAVATGSGGGRR
ncbi:hypothetical protein MMPV_006887 [Pyropia vietnamensis]